MQRVREELKCRPAAIRIHERGASGSGSRNHAIVSTGDERTSGPGFHRGVIANADPNGRSSPPPQ